MRVSSVTATRWRNVRNLYLDVPQEARFVCLVGENGTGKSSVLELIAWAAHHGGLAPGIPLKRRPPESPGSEFDIEVVFDLERRNQLGPILVPLFEQSFGPGSSTLSDWDGTLTVGARGWSGDLTPDLAPGVSHTTYHGVGGTAYWASAGGVQHERAVLAGQQIAQMLRELPELLHLYLDAERVFPPVEVRDEEVLAFARQEVVPGWLKSQAAQLTQNLYLEWMRSMLGDQQRRQSEYYQRGLQARKYNVAVEPPDDPLASYAQDLAQVLPHLRFVRLDQESRRLIFDSAGQELPYEELSGGERELAFLVGQLVRFGMRDGLFVLDEPELHLNAELLRGWLDYLRGSVREGQAWIATHSLEAAEVAGPSATFVLERDDDRVVRRAVPLADRPALSTLAAALGTPAFAVARSRFVLIEGTRERRERERFAIVLDARASDRFIEADGCDEVIARVRALRDLASEEEQLRVTGVVDRDFRTTNECAELHDRDGIFVLPVHEVENFFLQPELLKVLLTEQARDPADALPVLQLAMDRHAGRWAFQKAKSEGGWRGDVTSAARVAGDMTWDSIVADVEVASRQVATAFVAVSDLERAQRRVALRDALEEYRDVRGDLARLWRECFGKEVLARTSNELGFRDSSAAETRAAVLWRTGQVARPAEAVELREHLDSVRVLGD
jgi:ABC-type thiamine transport system ATPase subunit